MAEEISQQQRERIRERLESLREEYRAELVEALEDHEEEDMRRIAGEVRDAGENSVADTVADLNLGLLDVRTEELAEVERALVRLRGGDYGTCAGCGEAIDADRLEAAPTATRCLLCQQKHEREFGGSGRHSL